MTKEARNWEPVKCLSAAQRDAIRDWHCRILDEAMEASRLRPLVALGPPHPPGWLIDDRPAVSFLAEVVRAGLDVTTELDAARLFGERWGPAALRTTLASVRVDLSPALADLLRELERAVRPTCACSFVPCALGRSA